MTDSFLERLHGGAGDRDGNGVVTLAEAYAHVYARTLAATVPSGDQVLSLAGHDGQPLGPGTHRVRWQR